MILRWLEKEELGFGDRKGRRLVEREFAKSFWEWSEEQVKAFF